MFVGFVVVSMVAWVSYFSFRGVLFSLAGLIVPVDLVGWWVPFLAMLFFFPQSSPYLQCGPPKPPPKLVTSPTGSKPLDLQVNRNWRNSEGVQKRQRFEIEAQKNLEVKKHELAHQERQAERELEVKKLDLDFRLRLENNKLNKDPVEMTESLPLPSGVRSGFSLEGVSFFVKALGAATAATVAFTSGVVTLVDSSTPKNIGASVAEYIEETEKTNNPDGSSSPRISHHDKAYLLFGGSGLPPDWAFVYTWMVLFVVVYFVRRGKSFTPGVGNFQTLTQYVGFSLLGAGWFSSVGMLVKHREYHAEVSSYFSFLGDKLNSVFFCGEGKFCLLFIF